MFTKKQKKKLNSKNNIKQKKGVIMNTMGESTAVEVVGQAFKKIIIMRKMFSARMQWLL